jgi:hypothetical protein
MIINFNTNALISCSLLKESQILAWFNQDKRILMIETLAFAALAAAFFFVKKIFPSWLIFKSYFAPVAGEINQDNYTVKGTFKNGLLEGAGTRSRDREIETGTYRKGKLEGKGSIVTGSTTIEGDFKEGVLCGEGVIRYRNKISKKGFFKKGKLHGQGMEINLHHQKRKLEGEFFEGVLHGQGKITFTSTGTSYSGDFIHGVLTENMAGNQKRKIYQSGEIEEGQFDGGGKLSGSGKRISKKGDMISEGVFLDGQLNGSGKVTYGNNICHQGSYKNGLLEGQGTIRFPNGMSFQGNFIKGILIEKMLIGLERRVYTDADSPSIEIGEFKKYPRKEDWLIKGKRIHFSSNGDAWEERGEFESVTRRLHGTGIVLLNGQTFQKGYFNKGIMNGHGTLVINGMKKKGYFKDGFLV